METLKSEKNNVAIIEHCDMSSIQLCVFHVLPHNLTRQIDKIIALPNKKSILSHAEMLNTSFLLF